MFYIFDSLSTAMIMLVQHDWLVWGPGGGVRLLGSVPLHPGNTAILLVWLPLLPGAGGHLVLLATGDSRARVVGARLVSAGTALPISTSPLLPGTPSSDIRTSPHSVRMEFPAVYNSDTAATALEVEVLVVVEAGACEAGAECEAALQLEVEDGLNLGPLMLPLTGPVAPQPVLVTEEYLGYQTELHHGYTAGRGVRLSLPASGAGGPGELRALALGPTGELARAGAAAGLGFTMLELASPGRDLPCLPATHAVLPSSLSLTANISIQTACPTSRQPDPAARSFLVRHSSSAVSPVVVRSDAGYTAGEAPLMAGQDCGEGERGGAGVPAPRPRSEK